MSDRSSAACIAIVSPSGYASDPAAYEQAVARLRAQGHVVHDYTAPSEKFQRFGASDGARLAQLHAAARDADVQIVMALRGGYGLSRLLPEIDFRLLAESGKLFVGHSDFTALQMGLLAQTGAA
ncbi:MAG: Muramoyltetrapeptide carboxypeptidase, partial [Pseudomonadota bacterium]